VTKPLYLGCIEHIVIRVQ